MATAERARQQIQQGLENAARSHHQELVAVYGWHPEAAARVTRMWLLLRGYELEQEFWENLATPVVVEECEHGMARWLCAGPGHYPQDL